VAGAAGGGARPVPGQDHVGDGGGGAEQPVRDLLAAWLRSRLKVDDHARTSDGPESRPSGSARAGDIAITRPDGLLASYAVPGQPERLVALKRVTSPS
jgi:hypothetical protein